MSQGKIDPDRLPDAVVWYLDSTIALPILWNLDIGAYYPIRFGENRQLSFQMNWFNVFNSQRAIKQDETFLINGSIFGVPPIGNPFYGAERSSSIRRR